MIDCSTVHLRGEGLQDLQKTHDRLVFDHSSSRGALGSSRDLRCSIRSDHRHLQFLQLNQFRQETLN